MGNIVEGRKQLIINESKSINIQHKNKSPTWGFILCYLSIENNCEKLFT